MNKNNAAEMVAKTIIARTTLIDMKEKIPHEDHTLISMELSLPTALVRAYNETKEPMPRVHDVHWAEVMGYLLICGILKVGGEE